MQKQQLKQQLRQRLVLISEQSTRFEVFSVRLGFSEDQLLLFKVESPLWLCLASSLLFPARF